MSISGISSVSAAASNPQVGNDFRSRMQQTMTTVASKLGMSPGDLKTALKAGKSLADVATSKGVSKDDLIATIKQSLTSNGAPLTDAAATQLANRMADHKGGGHHHHHHAADGATAPVASAPSSPTDSSTGQILSQLA